MSKATNQSLALLAIASASLIVIYEEGRIADKKAQSLVSDAIYDLEKAIAFWPGEYNHEWVQERILKWDNMPCPIQKKYKSAVLLSMCERAIIDLFEKLNDKRKKKMLEKVLSPIQELMGIYSKDGIDFYIPTKAGQMVDQLKDVVEWVD